jgi:hypothetical protein
MSISPPLALDVSYRIVVSAEESEEQREGTDCSLLEDRSSPLRSLPRRRALLRLGSRRHRPERMVGIRHEDLEEDPLKDFVKSRVAVEDSRDELGQDGEPLVRRELLDVLLDELIDRGERVVDLVAVAAEDGSRAVVGHSSVPHSIAPEDRLTSPS